MRICLASPTERFCAVGRFVGELMTNSVRAFSHRPLPDLQFRRSRISKTFYNRSNFSKCCVTVISGRPLTLRRVDIRFNSGEICGSRRNESSRRVDTCPNDFRDRILSFFCTRSNTTRALSALSSNLLPITHAT